MNWTVNTNSIKLTAGTILHFAEMTDDTTPPSVISPGDTFGLEYADGSRDAGVVKAAMGTQISVEMRDQSTWTLRPHNLQDRPVRIDSPGLHSQNWVVL